MKSKTISTICDYEVKFVIQLLHILHPFHSLFQHNLGKPTPER